MWFVWQMQNIPNILVFVPDELAYIPYKLWVSGGWVEDTTLPFEPRQMP
jgi:hypothetical protein